MQQHNRVRTITLTAAIQVSCSKEIFEKDDVKEGLLVITDGQEWFKEHNGDAGDGGAQT